MDNNHQPLFYLFFSQWHCLLSACYCFRCWLTYRTLPSWTTLLAGCLWRNRVRALSTTEPTMLPKVHLGLGLVRVMVKARAICQVLGWALGILWDTVKHQNKEMELMIHPKTLWSKAEAMEFSLIQPKVRCSESWLVLFRADTDPETQECIIILWRFTNTTLIMWPLTQR